MKKNINYIIIKICLLIIIGILGIITPTNYINEFHLILYFGIFIYTLIQIIISIKRKTFSYFNLIILIISLIMAVTIKYNPKIYIKLIPIIIGTYILIIGIARLTTIFVYNENEIKESKINILINSLVHLTFSIILFISPNTNIKSFTFILGIYLILLGISYIPKGSHDKGNIKIVQIPVIFQSIKPYRDFIKIDFEHYNNQDNDIDVDLEILIHVRKNRRGVFGHSDLVYNNKVYSYGNYDVNAQKLKDAIGEGVLVECNKEQYIKYCKSYGKSLFSFGIKLNKEEKEELDKRFKSIMNNTYIFEKEKIVKDSYIDKLNKNAEVNFYKFKSGHYKKYFFLNYNCTKFIEEVISPELLDFVSFKTPGTLYSNLEEAYQKENSKVVRKIIY